MKPIQFISHSFTANPISTILFLHNDFFKYLPYKHFILSGYSLTLRKTVIPLHSLSHTLKLFSDFSVVKCIMLDRGLINVKNIHWNLEYSYSHNANVHRRLGSCLHEFSIFISQSSYL